MGLSATVNLDWHGEDITDAMVDAVAAKALDAAEIVAAKARQLAPVDSGALRDSIRAARSKFADGGAVVLAGSQEAFYPHMIEYGTSHAPAKPFLRPALEASASQIKDLIESAIAEVAK